MTFKYTEKIMNHYTILMTPDGYMVETETDEGGTEYIHAVGGDNLFDEYKDASRVLAHHLLERTV